ncbi:MAG: glucosaminidase domain-containing protein [Muribaculaceae bacterium]|nr:glucosaminidase domain-containing protein [Muribaculaceae bacterium]
MDYIERYKQVALQSAREYGVPASITLAQGLLESYVGKSKMAVEANNHFGIKAYHWQGEVYGRCDSLKQVGYRKYGTPEDSFLDHAQFLKGPRYSILYQFDITDYRSWAQGLRDCGYAEDANYPAKLINIIEQYELYALDGGKRLNGDRVIQQDEAEEQPNNDRWHHRKRRNRTTDQNQVQQEQSQENQPTFTPMRQGRVGSSADND